MSSLNSTETLSEHNFECIFQKSEFQLLVVTQIDDITFNKSLMLIFKTMH